MTQLATIKEASNYLCISHHQEFALMFGGDDKKATSFLAVALACVQRDPKLLQCNRESVRDSLLEAAQVDLCPGSALGHAFLIPYGRQCQFQIGYKGLCEVVQREGAVKKVWGNVVYQDEVDEGLFKVIAGDEHRLIHDRDPFREDPPSWDELLEAGLCGAYACAMLHNGETNFEVVGLDVLKRARNMSTSPAYKTWATEMVKKFPLKRLCKRLPKTLSIERWAAIEEKHGLRDAIPLKETAVEVADDALGNTTVDVKPYMPKAECPRSGVNWEIQRAWDLLDDEQVAALEMDRELDDFLSDDKSSDAEARHFLGKMLELLS